MPNPNPTCVPGRGVCPGEHAGWGILNADGTSSGASIVCTPEVCGNTNGVIGTNGWFAGQHWVLATLQDPEGHPNSLNGGNVVGGGGGTYNFATGVWTFLGDHGDTYVRPLAYPGTDAATPQLVYSAFEENPLRPSGTPGTVGGGAPGSNPNMTPTWVALSQMFTPPVTLESSYPVVITDAAAERRLDLAAGLITSLGSGQIGSAVDSAKRLAWVYIYSGLRALPADERASVREDLKTTAIDSIGERTLVNLGFALARLDLANTIVQAATDGSSTAGSANQQASCVNALVVGRVKAARAACTGPPAAATPVTSAAPTG